VNRARTAEAKLARREHILHAAVDLVLHVPYEHVTMAEVARAAGLAKGTPYLYWHTKEELFLGALQAEYADLLGAMAARIPQVPPDPASMAAAITDEVVGRKRLCALVGLMHVVLERNAPLDVVVAFKRSVLAGVLDVAAALHRHLGWLSIEEAARLQLRLHGAIVAFRQMADPSDEVKAALQQPDLAPLNVDFEREIRDLVHDLLIAARAKGEAGAQGGGGTPREKGSTHG
jgi:AcrR family transcriptional regulator